MKKEIDAKLLLRKIEKVNPFRRERSASEAFAVEATKADIRELILYLAEMSPLDMEKRKCKWCNVGELSISTVNGLYTGECGNCHCPCTNAHKSVLSVIDEWNSMMEDD